MEVYLVKQRLIFHTFSSMCLIWPFVCRAVCGCFTLITMSSMPIRSEPSSVAGVTAASLVKNLQFIRRGEAVRLSNVPNTRTLLQLLREDLGCSGTKEGCNEGDCGACTVVLAEVDAGELRFKAVNSCIRMAHSIDGMALWTVEDIAPTLVAARTALPPERVATPAAWQSQIRGPGLKGSDAAPNGRELASKPDVSLRLQSANAGSAAPAGHAEVAKPTLHPAQQAMLDKHGSQCGFCTPGFIMSMFGTYQNHVCKNRPVTRELAQEELSGNLCRCTGYRPILEAAQAMASYPRAALDTASLLQKLEHIKPAALAQEADSTYKLPQTLAQLLQHRADHPGAQIVAGCTDVGLWVNKLHLQFENIIDVTQVRELRRIDEQPGSLLIGAAVTLNDAYAALVKDRPQLHTFATRFAGLPVRNSGTLGGNVANGSPIGDSMPLLIALRAGIGLASVRGEREMPLENLYVAYRKNVMAADEVLAWIRVPKPAAHENAKIYKISKRFDDDISAVCLAINLQIEGDQVVSASIGAGGVAATPVRASRTEAILTGQPWTQETVTAAMAVLRAEFTPISDLRASSAYRVQVLGNLLQRYWLESQGLQQISLESFRLEDAT
jgi:xanthine dehydrogenase small subunit